MKIVYPEIKIPVSMISLSNCYESNYRLFISLSVLYYTYNYNLELLGKHLYITAAQVSKPFVTKLEAGCYIS